MLYENLDVWKRSRLMTIEVYRVLKDCRDYGFKDQITRSILSLVISPKVVSEAQ
jgi:four helix bundle protein